MSKTQPSRRWHPSHYKSSALAPYITEYGWENIEHRVLIDGLTKEQAEAKQKYLEFGYIPNYIKNDDLC